MYKMNIQIRSRFYISEKHTYTCRSFSDIADLCIMSEAGKLEFSRTWYTHIQLYLAIDKYKHHNDFGFTIQIYQNNILHLQGKKHVCKLHNMFGFHRITHCFQGSYHIFATFFELDYSRHRPWNKRKVSFLSHFFHFFHQEAMLISIAIIDVVRYEDS